MTTFHPARVLTDGERATLDALRAIDRRPARRAVRVLEERGFPSRRNEAWKYSDLRAALAGALPLHVTAGDGRHVRQYQPVDDAGDPIAMLAGALAGELFFDGATRQNKTYVFDNYGVRALKIYGSALIVERLSAIHGLGASSLTADVSGDLTRIVIHDGAEDDIALSTASVSVGGQFRQFVLSTGAKLARIETHVRLDREGAQVELNGAYMCGPGRHADLTSTIEHKVGGGVTRQLIKGVARKGGRGVFQGKIVVERGAQKTDARQHHRGMLLEEGAEIFAKPELMIYADDVQCAHGNTAGGLDEQVLFYLRSRGVPETEARGLLVEAFLAETIPADLPPALTEELLGRMRTWLGGAA